jgi:hypothetical protein
MLLVTFLASALFIPEAWLSSSNQKTGLFAFLGLSNFVLSSNTVHLFAFVVLFAVTYVWLYLSIVRFKAPRWMVVRKARGRH